jgi:hypothetical protein
LNIVIIYGSEDKLWSFLAIFFHLPATSFLFESRYIPQYPILRPIQCAYILCLSWPSFRPIQKLIKLLAIYFNLYVYEIGDG